MAERVAAKLKFEDCDCFADIEVRQEDMAPALDGKANRSVGSCTSSARSAMTTSLERPPQWLLSRRDLACRFRANWRMPQQECLHTIWHTGCCAIEPKRKNVVQEAYLRAFRAFASFKGPAIKPWLACDRAQFPPTTALEARKRGSNLVVLAKRTLNVRDDARSARKMVCATPISEALVIAEWRGAKQVLAALAKLPLIYRENRLFLREIEGLSYNEIAEVIGLIPIGTVMVRVCPRGVAPSLRGDPFYRRRGPKI